VFQSGIKAYCISQYALAVVVEVNEGENSALLPCKYLRIIPENEPTVMWTRNDLDPKTIHLREEGGDDLRGQNRRYSGRTSVRSDALDSGDFSLTLRNPQLTDSSSYTCSISAGREAERVTVVKLQVKGQYCRQRSELKLKGIVPKLALYSRIFFSCTS
uniref:Ig-like domain-containing protein n=1 Tax=Amphilophus citrinellus TaxID=61819 RepID=A0A3Q0RSZ2_AMPCI